VLIVFHSPDMPRISPVVDLPWDRPPADLIRLVRPHIHADLPEGACAEFIGACFSVPDIDAGGITVCNVPYPPEWHADEGDRFAWFRRLLAEVRAWSPPAVLVNLDPPFDITLGDAVLGRWLPRGS
jgi:hypothetical protein